MADDRVEPVLQMMEHDLERGECIILEHLFLRGGDVMMGRARWLMIMRVCLTDITETSIFQAFLRDIPRMLMTRCSSSRQSQRFFSS
ncbi:hypothetical protein A6X21_11340 [Planctopirus hydrillae]|uniref:Uncharacterized protein n=1 Tax=Planctopirus hydrillae TaxID=1841610 RepID=A0A1C3E6N7_9PLAN|nr:hypothetical protein A6X21_11340 [Planctopirus hydrillae]